MDSGHIKAVGVPLRLNNDLNFPEKAAGLPGIFLGQFSKNTVRISVSLLNQWPFPPIPMLVQTCNLISGHEAWDN